VLDGLRGEDSIAELCRREDIAQSLYHVWSKEFLEAGKRLLAGDTARAAATDEVRGLRRIGVDPVGKLLGPSAGLIADASKAAGAPIGAATGDAITDSQAEAAKRLVPFQSYIGMRQALDLFTTDE